MSGRDVEDDCRQADRDGGRLLHAGQVHRGDELLGERRGAVGRHVVQLGEQGRLAGVGLHADLDRRGPEHSQRGLERGGLEGRGLTRQAGQRIAQGAERPEDRARPGQSGERGGAPAGRVEDGLLGAPQRQGLGLGCVGRGGADLHGGHVAVERPGDRSGHLEPDVLRAAVSLEVAVEPGAGEVGEPVALRHPAVVAAREPDLLDRPRDAVGVADRLRQREQRVGLPLHQQGRGLDPVEVRAARPQQAQDVGRRRALGGALLVGRAHVRGESPAGRRWWAAGQQGAWVRPGDAEEDPGPGTLEHPVGGRVGVLGEQRGGEVVPGDLRRGRVDPRVGGGEQQRQPAAVRGPGHAHPRVTGTVGEHLGPGGQQVQQRARVLHLEVRAVDVDQSAGRAEAAGAVGEHDVAVAGERLGLVGETRLAAPEPVGQQDGRRRGPVGQEERRVELHRIPALLRPDGHLQDLGPHGRRVPAAGQPDHDGERGEQDDEPHSQQGRGPPAARSPHPVPFRLMVER